MPLLDYAANYTYYSEVLCINKDLPELACKGQCILMQKVQAKAEQENPLNQIIINADEEIPEILPTCVYPSYHTEVLTNEWALTSCLPVEGFMQVQTPPPQLS